MRKRRYLFVGPGAGADGAKCDVYRTYGEDSNGMEYVGTWRGEDPTRRLVELLNTIEEHGRANFDEVVEAMTATTSPIHSVRKAVNVACRVAEYLGINYAEATADQIISELAKRCPRGDGGQA